VFSDAWQRYRDVLADNRVLFFAGDVDAAREEHSVRVSEVIEPGDAPRELCGVVQFELADAGPLAEIRALVDRHRGDRPRPVAFSLRPEPGLRVVVRADERAGVDPTPGFIDEAVRLLGPGGLLLRPLPPGARSDRPNGRGRNGARGAGAPRAWGP